MSSCRLRRTRLMRLVNSLLWSPAVHRLATEVEAAGDVTHTSACCDQVKDSLPELRLITESAHTVLLLRQQHGSPAFTPARLKATDKRASTLPSGPTKVTMRCPGKLAVHMRSKRSLSSRAAHSSLTRTRRNSSGHQRCVRDVAQCHEVSWRMRRSLMRRRPATSCSTRTPGGRAHGATRTL